MGEAEPSGNDLWVLVVEDHPLFRDALVLTLQMAGGYGQIRTAGSLAEGLATLRAHGRPGLVIFDLGLPDVTTLDGLVRIRDEVAPTPVVVVSALTDNRVIDGVLKAGASGFVPKDSPRAVIRAALRAVASGEVYVPEDFSAPEDGPGAAEIAERLATLTDQQKRILGFICEGQLNKQIAYELSITEPTVKAHVTAIMRKLGVGTRTQAVLAVQRARLEGGPASGT